LEEDDEDEEELEKDEELLDPDHEEPQSGQSPK
jgi:hypothetical protein